MTSAEILAVAARCESETPNVYLASVILVAAGHQTLFRGEKLGWEWRKDGKGIWSPMPRPDLSLDAAGTLVPEGWVVHTLCQNNGKWSCALCTAPRSKDWLAHGGVAKTEPMARVIAALRARAAMAEDAAGPT